MHAKPKPASRRCLFYTAIGVACVLALTLVLPAVQVCRDWAFVDRNTGARKGYREWFFGWRTGLWYQETAVEIFMRSKHPEEFRQQWMSYAGTGRNIFGGATVHGHGRPGRILLLKPEVISDYCAQASDAEKRRLYDVFSSGDQGRIQELVDQIFDAVIAGRSRSAERRDPVGETNVIRSATNDGTSATATGR